MSITPLNKIHEEFILPGWRSAAKEQYGYMASGDDRNHPLRYDLLEGKVISWRYFTIDGSLDPNPDPCSVSVHTMRPFSDGCIPYLNKAYGKFVEEVHSGSANLGEAFGEWGQSFKMITQRASGLARAAGALRRGNFRGFLNALSTNPKRRHRGKVRNTADEVSGLWLEYHYGWSPLLGDIYGACEVISEPLPSGESFYGFAITSGVDSGFGQTASYKSIFRVGGKVKVTNPNLALLSQLGLVNPALIAWNLIPFSFLADWCFDISSFLGSYSDFAGMEVTDGYHTGLSKYEWTCQPSFNQTGIYKAKQAFMARRLGIPRPLPNFQIGANLGQSASRAASAVSLLIQRLV